MEAIALQLAPTARQLNITVIHPSHFYRTVTYFQTFCKTVTGVHVEKHWPLHCPSVVSFCFIIDYR